MNTYHVIWFYYANYGGPIRTQADGPEEAAKLATEFYSEDFHRKATVLVFNSPPSYIKKGE